MAECILVSCKVCGGMSELFDVVDQSRTCAQEDSLPLGVSGVAVYYRLCRDCGFVFTDHFDSWTVERWSANVYNSDYEKVDPEFVAVRPERTVAWMDQAIGRSARGLDILDYGAGNGMTERLLRQHGFDSVTSFDPVFNPTWPARQFDLVTAFEVVEHSPDPVTSFRQLAGLLKPFGLCVVQTCLVPENPKSVRSRWWYIGPRNGHVSLYSRGALACLARSNGLSFFTDGAVSFLYRDMMLTEGSLRDVKVAESFMGWSDPGSDFAALVQGEWHEAERVVAGGSTFRWTSAAAGSRIILCRPELFVGTFSITVPCIALVEGAGALSVEVMLDDTLTILEQQSTHQDRRFVVHSTGSRTITLSLGTEKVVCPSPARDPRHLGAAIARPVVAAA